jgi:hypothetical protein
VRVLHAAGDDGDGGDDGGELVMMCVGEVLQHSCGCVLVLLVLLVLV